MPQGSPIWFEGVKTTARTRDMIREARKLARLSPRISQGGYNAGGVRASAGTHDRDALDLATSGYSREKCLRLEKALWTVGFAAWWRRYMWNVWPQHHHSVPRGGDLSAGAAAQVRAADAGRDGLAGNRYYPGIGAYRGRTWEKYLAARDRKKLKINGRYYPDPGTVRLQFLTASWRTGKFSRHTFLVQTWLRRLGLYKARRDGRVGPLTREAYNAFRRSVGYTGTDATGLPGLASLTKLRDRAKSPRKVLP